MDRLHLSCLGQAQVLVKNRLREPCRPGGEIDRAEVVVCQFDTGLRARIIRDHLPVTLREIRASVADVHQQAAVCEYRHVGLDTGDELRTEEQHADLRQICAVEDLARGVPEVERHRDGTGLQDTEIHRQPFQTVEHQDGDLVPFFDTAVDEHVGDAVGLLIEHLPGDLPAVRMHDGLLDEFEFLPGRLGGILYRRVELDERDLIAVFPRVADEQICYGHDNFLFSFLLICVLWKRLTYLLYLLSCSAAMFFPAGGDLFAFSARKNKSAAPRDRAFDGFVRRCKDQLSFSL